MFGNVIRYMTFYTNICNCITERHIIIMIPYSSFLQLHKERERGGGGGERENKLPIIGLSGTITQSFLTQFHRLQFAILFRKDIKTRIEYEILEQKIIHKLDLVQEKFNNFCQILWFHVQFHNNTCHIQDIRCTFNITLKA